METLGYAKEFAEFEEQERLFDREYAGIPYWQYLRFDVCLSAFWDYIEKDSAAKNEISRYQKMKDLVRIGAEGIKSFTSILNTC